MKKQTKEDVLDLVNRALKHAMDTPVFPGGTSPNEHSRKKLKEFRYTFEALPDLRNREGDDQDE